MYTNELRERYAGSLRGFLKSGTLSSIPEKDPFKKWLNAHLENGPEEVKGRIKPFYAADFGTRKDLDRGENPKIMIVQRLLKPSSDGKDIVSNTGVDTSDVTSKKDILPLKLSYHGQSHYNSVFDSTCPLPLKIRGTDVLLKHRCREGG